MKDTLGIVTFQGSEGTSFGPITLARFTPDQIAVLTNGCGPAGWKVHSWRWRIAQWLTPRLRTACNAHDLAYVVGGTEFDRIAADHVLREDIASIARESGWLVGWLLEQEQPILYGLVEREGRKHWHTPRRTLEEVIALADERIKGRA